MQCLMVSMVDRSRKQKLMNQNIFSEKMNGIGSILLFVGPINNLCLRRRQKVQRVIEVLSSTPYNTL